MAAACHGAKLVGTARLKIKESDRGLVMAEELAKFGVSVQVDDNEIIVKNGVLQAPTEVLQSHNDHRIAMTLATLCTITGGTIDGAESVKKSYPSYYEVIEDLGVVLTREV
jgi:3-phosphoshikimate 1-carboxyvinyltransferase